MRFFISLIFSFLFVSSTQAGVVRYNLEGNFTKITGMIPLEFTPFPFPDHAKVTGWIEYDASKVHSDDSSDKKFDGITYQFDIGSFGISNKGEHFFTLIHLLDSNGLIKGFWDTAPALWPKGRERQLDDLIVNWNSVGGVAHVYPINGPQAGDINFTFVEKYVPLLEPSPNGLFFLGLVILGAFRRYIK